MAQVQRPLRGSRISTFYPIKSLPSLASLDSAFQLQEYISLLIRLDVHDVDAIVAVPGRAKQKEKEREADIADDAAKDRKAEVTVDEACWKYEQLRRLAQDLSHPLITMLQQVCTRTTCPEMKAGEWLYLCVAHGNDGAMEQCCAIDYILHTLDSATALLNSPRAFPSRLQIPPASHRHFTSLARRLGRIFAHAYFHHREEFEQAEAESSLYARFLALTEKFDLVPADFLVIPPRATPEAPPPTLLGAALRLDTTHPSSASSSSNANNNNNADPASPADAPASATRETSASPPGLEEGAGTRRYGRSRTDTMMLEGDKDREGRFPMSPASPATSAPEEGAAAAFRPLVDVPAVAASPAPVVQRAAPEPEPEEEEGEEQEEEGVKEQEEPEKVKEETELEKAKEKEKEEEPEQEKEKEKEGQQEQEQASPTSDEEVQAQAQAGPALPIISPSSSTAPQSETPILFDLEQGREEAPAPAVVAADVLVPTISVEPATPPAVDEKEEEKEEDKETDKETVSDAQESVVAKEEEGVAVVAEAPKEAVDVVLQAPAAAAAEEEEVDVTDSEKDAEGGETQTQAVDAEKAAVPEAAP
ncbi:Mob1/phocein [Mycena epipterygia]|nr:Mob1/phocein [Mycena epipterygia]